MARFAALPVLSFSVYASTVLFFYLYWRKRRKVRRVLSLSPEATKVLFFPDTETVSRTGALEELSNTLNSAAGSLDVCVFAISNWKLVDVLISAHQRGVVVRVITDKDQMSMNPSPIEKMRRNRIQVRRNNDSYFMHHKFAIVDRKRLVNGSLNWTQQAMHGNQENIVISCSTDIVEPFQRQFELLWEQFHPLHYCNSDLQ